VVAPPASALEALTAASQQSYEVITSEEKKLRHHVIVRKGMTVRQTYTAIGHAAGESGALGTKPNDQTIFVALQGTVEEIETILPKLDQRGYRYVKVIEDLPPYVGELVAVGLEPSVDNRLRKILYHFEQAGE